MPRLVRQPTPCPGLAGRAGAASCQGLALLLRLLLSTQAAGCFGHGGQGPGLSSVPLPASAPGGIWHTVAKGETLELLSRRYGVTLQDLAEINDLPDPDRLLAGREIFVPAATGARQEEGATASPTSCRPAGKEEQASSLRRSERSSGSVEKQRGLFRWPLSRARLTSRFGRRWGRQHEGIDLAAPIGTPIRAAAAGTVIYSGHARGYGNIVLLAHGQRWVTVYAHNDRNLVEQGQQIERGQSIARLGNTGRSTGPHLHFEIRDDGKPRNPLFFLSLEELKQR